MGAKKLDPDVINNAIGLYITRSRRVVLDTDFGELATWLKCTTAGTVVWYNENTDETGVWEFEAGEGWPIGCTQILTNAIIDGSPESTTATGILWGVSGTDLGRPE